MDSEFGAFLAGCFITFWVGLLFIVSPFFTPNSYWEAEAIERGYALYCPLDGEFAWKGECDANQK